MVPGHQWNREFKTVKKIILAAALASVAVPAMAADARARAVRMTRDEAYERVFSSIDEVINRRGMT